MATDVTSEVRLRPVQREDLPLLERIRSDESLAGPYSWYGFGALAGLTNRFEEDRFLGQDRGMLVVTADDDMAGTVSWHQVVHGPNQGSRCWNIGIYLLPDHRGQGIGSHAQRLLADYLFDTTLAARVEASTEADNLAEQRALEKAGFQREGVLRRAHYRAGAHRDMVLYSRIRE